MSAAYSKIAFSLLLSLTCFDNSLLPVLLEDTLVKTARGMVPVEQLKNDDQIVSCNTNKSLTFVNIVQKYTSHSHDVIAIETTHGAIRAAPKPKDGVGIATGVALARAVSENEDKLKPFIEHAGSVLRWTTEAFEASKQYAMQENKLGHILEKSMHNLSELLNKFDKKPEELMHALLQAGEGILPVEGRFQDIVLYVKDTAVHTRGRVMNGVVKWGTLFVKK